MLLRLKAFSKWFTLRAMRRRRLAARYMHGEGIEIGALHNPLRTKARVKYVDRLSRADLRRQYPELAALPVVDPDIVDDGEKLRKVADGSQDFIIANHFIEHCENPIGTLQTFARKLRPRGVIYMAIPDKRYTFDRRRPSTTFEHLVADFGDNGAASRAQHHFEFAKLACFDEPASDEKAREVAAKNLADNYSIHFHVWTLAEFKDFLGQARECYFPQLTVIESVQNGDEGIFVLQSQ